MRAGFTEFTYAFAVMEELARHPYRQGSYRTLPIIPSLRAEGQAGGGYDLKIDGFRRGGPLFIQFKVSEYMSRASAKEWSCYGKPFYRFKLWGRKRSNQHQLLLDLERQYSQSVWYVAPTFHKEEKLSLFYQKLEISQNSIWVRPGAIGPFQDDQDHSVTHVNGGPVYRFSEPEQIQEGFAFDADQAVLSLSQNEAPLEENLESALEQMLAVLEESEEQVVSRPLIDATENGRIAYLDSARPSDLISGMPLAYQVEFLARHYFGCATILIAEENQQIKE